MEPEHFDWFGKARSRLWAPAPDLSRVPKLALFVGTFAYSGLSPVSSGTAGSLVAVLLYYFLPPLQGPLTLALACAVVLVIGTWSAGIVERSLEQQDPGIVVIDEVLGQWIALFSLTALDHSVATMIFAFLFFRAFDIVKLPPARFFERRPGGFGIMMDDAVAGVYANVATRVLVYLLYRFIL